MALAERAGLSDLIRRRVGFTSSRLQSAGANPAGKLTSIVAGMAAGADSIDDLDAIRSGGMPRLFGGVYAAATLGQFLREFTHGHTLQLASVLRAHLVGLVQHSELLPGIGEQAYVDIDSLLRPVFGHAKQGASYGHTKIAGKQVLRKGLSPLATTLSTRGGAPVLAGIRLRAGRAGSGRGAATMVRDAIRTARAAGATGEVLVRGDSAYGNHAVIGGCLKADVRFSFVLVKNPTVTRAIATIPDQAWTPVHYPGSVHDPDTGKLISDAEVAEVAFTAFGSTRHPVTARLIVRRVRDRAKPDELFPVWRHHPFLTNSLEPTAQADITHRRHAIIENRVRRPDRRTPRPPTVGPIRRQQRLGDLRGDHPQPAPRRRHTRQSSARRGPRRHPTAATDHRPRPARPPATPPDAAPAHALALGQAVAGPGPPRGPARPPTADQRITRPPPPAARLETTVEKLGRPAPHPRPDRNPTLTPARHPEATPRALPLHGSRLRSSVRLGVSWPGDNRRPGVCGFVNDRRRDRGRARWNGATGLAIRRHRDRADPRRCCRGGPRAAGAVGGTSNSARRALCGDVA